MPPGQADSAASFIRRKRKIEFWIHACVGRDYQLPGTLRNSVQARISEPNRCAEWRTLSQPGEQEYENETRLVRARALGSRQLDVEAKVCGAARPAYLASGSDSQSTRPTLSLRPRTQARRRPILFS
jgi:hypothetical protein